MNDDYDFAGKSEADILLSYTANKGHRTRQLTKVTSLFNLQADKYSKITEKTLVAAVKDLEKFSDRLTKLSSYLVLFKLESGPALETEAAGFQMATQKWADDVYKHTVQQAAAKRA